MPQLSSVAFLDIEVAPFDLFIIFYFITTSHYQELKILEYKLSIEEDATQQRDNRHKPVENSSIENNYSGLQITKLNKIGDNIFMT